LNEISSLSPKNLYSAKKKEYNYIISASTRPMPSPKKRNLKFVNWIYIWSETKNTGGIETT